MKKKIVNDKINTSSNFLIKTKIKKVVHATFSYLKKKNNNKICTLQSALGKLEILK